MEVSRKILTYQGLRGYLKELQWFLISKLPETVIVVTLLLCVFLASTLIGNAQEIDTPTDVVIDTVLETQPEQIVIDTPPADKPEGVAVIDERDIKRLDIMAFQSLSFETTGEYTQIKDAQVIEGDVIGFEASMVGVVEPTEEIHVYDAPCGKGWQLLVKEEVDVQVTSSTTGQVFRTVQPIVRSYGYGCEHDSRTYNW